MRLFRGSDPKNEDLMEQGVISSAILIGGHSL